MTGHASYLLDVNVLIAMSWPTHRDHQKVQAWLSTHASSGWATCPLTQSAFVRLSSNPAVSTNALSPSEALAFLQANLAHPSHCFWPDEIALPQAVESLASQLTGHQQITDAYLLGLAIHKKGKLATLDRSILALLPPALPRHQFVELI